MKEHWTQTKAHLESVLPAHTYNTWIKPLSYRATSEGSIHIEVPNTFYKERIVSSYASLILAKLRQIAEDHLLNIQFVLPEAVKTSIPLESFSKIKLNSLHEKKEARAKQRIHSKYTFENFVVGAHNQFAHAAALAVSENPGMLYNPLFIYGGVGLGKTHLLCAIGHEILKNSPQKSILFKTSEDFVNQLIQSIRTQKMDEFRNQFRQGADVLLIDDIQFFSGKERTQEEFFHTFNSLHQANVQIVLTSDRMPKDIPDLDDRLRSRFESGLYCDISSPDLETRIAILKKKAEQSSLELPDDVAEYLALQNKENVRALEGALISLIAKASLQRRSLTLDFAKEVLASSQTTPLDIETIQRAVASFFHLSLPLLKSKTRTKNIALPRQLAMYLIRKHTHASYPEIGLKFGGKDHTTIIHAVDKIETLLITDPQFRHTLTAIEKTLPICGAY